MRRSLGARIPPAGPRAMHRLDDATVPLHRSTRTASAIVGAEFEIPAHRHRTRRTMVARRRSTVANRCDRDSRRDPPPTLARPSFAIATRRVATTASRPALTTDARPSFRYCNSACFAACADPMRSSDSAARRHDSNVIFGLLPLAPTTRQHADPAQTGLSNSRTRDSDHRLRVAPPHPESLYRRAPVVRIWRKRTMRQRISTLNTGYQPS